MTIAYWPGLGGGAASLIEVEPVLRERGLDVVVVDPRYGRRDDWSLGALAEELASSRADVYAGHSWGAAVAAAAAVLSPPRALVLLDGGHIGPRDFHRLGAAAPSGQAMRVASGHDVVWGLGPELGTLVADWLASSGAVE
jgi:pimeloyl-ACP methyl ester carboxylesterase